MNEVRPNIAQGAHPPTSHVGQGTVTAAPVRPMQPGGPIPASPLRPPAVIPPRPVQAPAEERLELVTEDRAVNEPAKSKIHGITAASGLPHHEYKRATHSNKTGAVRVRTFHCRLSEQGVEYLDQTINDWLEHHPEVEVKFTTSTVGQWDGKLKEPTLILNVWY
jgi:hypothetical protein